MVRKKIIQIIFSIILCGSLVFLTACQSKEDQRKSKIDQETTRVAKEIDEKLKVRGYTKENISEALLDIYYPQDQFPRFALDSGNPEGKSGYRIVTNSSLPLNPSLFCSSIPSESVDIKKKCSEVIENVAINNLEIIDKNPVLEIDIIDFTVYKNYEDWKMLRTEQLLDNKHAFLETKNKSRFVLISENSGHIKTKTKTDSESQKIENLIPETAEADRYEFMYTVFTKLNIPEN